VGDGSGVPSSTGGLAGFTFEAMVNPSQKKRGKKEEKRAQKGEEVMGRLTCQTKKTYG